MKTGERAFPAGSQKRVAVIGAGIAGLGAAWLLSRRYQVTLFEAGSYLGGHAHTVDAEVDGLSQPVDTGFLVFNRRTYPNLCGLFEHLRVPIAESDMSFSVSLAAPDIEWAGSNLASVFAQKSNLARPAFLKMLSDIVRFNRETTKLARDHAAPAMSLGEYLNVHGYSNAFRSWYLLPMAAAIWSCPTAQMLAYPLATFLRFCHNHGLLQVADRPQWLTVREGSRSYVRRIAAGINDIRLNSPVLAVNRSETGVQLVTQKSAENFDEVVFSCHSDQALRILGSSASVAERAILGAVQYQSNRAVLHTDEALLPRRKSVWSAWNYMAGQGDVDNRPVSVSYLINKLQPVSFKTPVVLSLNPFVEPAADKVLGEYDYAHPVFDQAAIDAQAHLPMLQGQRKTWFCGAWTGYGFHEDGLRSAVDVAAMLGVVAPWRAGQMTFDEKEFLENEVAREAA